MCIINDALCVIYDAQWRTLRLLQFWSFGRFFKRQKFGLEDFLVILLYEWRTVRHCVSFMTHCASLKTHSASLCDHNVGSPLYRGRLQSTYLCKQICRVYHYVVNNRIFYCNIQYCSHYKLYLVNIQLSRQNFFPVSASPSIPQASFSPLANTHR